MATKKRMKADDLNRELTLKEATATRAIGRIAPAAQFDYGDFRGVVSAVDGKTRFYPKLSKHYNTAMDVQPPPVGPLGRLDKAIAAIKRIYKNDVIGCCVISSRKHKIGILTGNDTGTPLQCTDAEVVSDYTQACGPGDNGCDMSVVNDFEKNVGMLMNGVRHKTDGGSVAVDNTQKLLVQVALDLLGTIDVGMNLPNKWYTSPDGADWGVVTGRDASIVGGHEVQAFDYDSLGVYIATWGGTRRILWPAWQARTWIDETYTSLSSDWYGNDKMAPNGIDAATLLAALATIAAGGVPVIPIPGPTPPVVPPVVPPTPPQPPVPTQALKTVAQTITIPASGPFNHAVQVVIPSVAVVNATSQLSSDSMQAYALLSRELGAIPALAILQLLLKFGKAVLPIILADVAAGKTIQQILADILASLGS